MMRFLGSFWFALILIALSAIGVVAATFLEASAASHGFAEEWVYQQPLFHLLLLGYFVNILLSALSRWPFKGRHAPFLITHLGLLMLISGVFIKSVWGTQGQLQLIEGTATDQLILPHQTALYIQSKFPSESHSIPLVNKQFPKGIADLKLLAWYPHASEKRVAWLKDNRPDLIGAPSNLITHTLKDVLLAEAVHEAEKLTPPFLLIHEDEDGTRNLLAKDLQGKVTVQSFSPERLESWVSYEGGYQGYTLQAEIPFVTPEDLKQAEEASERFLKEELRTHAINGEPFSPPLEIIKRASEKKGLDFPSETVNYLKAWARTKSWLFNQAEQFEVLLEAIDWNSDERNALYWIANLFQEDNLLERLKDWPLLQPLLDIQNRDLPSEEKKQLLFTTWMGQLYSIRHALPEPTEPLTAEMRNRMLSAYLRLHEIHYNTIPPLDLRLPTITLESPLRREITTLPLPKKREEATPLILIELEGRQLPLVYHAQGSTFKWPLGDGNTLLSFEPHRIPLPYTVRLHRARDLKYPGSQQTASFECTLSLIDKQANHIQPCHLRMNQVYETKDGYRFYLAGMGTIDALGVRNVQLVVSRDPAKYMLTYPGGGLVALGILLLFWGRRKP